MSESDYSFSNLNEMPAHEAKHICYGNFPKGTIITTGARETWYVHGFTRENDRYGKFYPFVICSKDPEKVNPKLLSLLALGNDPKYGPKEFRTDIEAWKARNL